MNKISNDTPNTKRTRRWVLWLLSELLLLIPIIVILLLFGRIIDRKQDTEESSSSIIEETSFIEGGTDYGLYPFDPGDGIDPAGL